jgi:hypothetical protein
VALDGLSYPDRGGRRPLGEKGNGGGGGGGGGGGRMGIFSPIQWTRHLIGRKVARRNKARHNDAGVRGDDNRDDDHAERQQLYRHPPMVIGSPAPAPPTRERASNPQRLRQRPPLAIASPTNNDRIAMGCEFEGYDHLRLPPAEGVATSRTLPKTGDRNRHRGTAANTRNDVNPWAGITGGFPRSGEANGAFPGSNNNDIGPLPFALKSDGPSPPGGVPQSGEADKAVPSIDGPANEAFSSSNNIDIGPLPFTLKSDVILPPGGVPQSGEADVTVPGIDEPFPFASNSAGVSPRPGEYDLTTGSGMPAFKWWTWKQQSSPLFCDGANSTNEERAGSSGQQQGQQSQPEGESTYFAFLCMLPNAAS